MPPGFAIAVLAACCLILSWLGSVAAQDAGSDTKLVFLGTGTPNADPDRSGPAVAVVVDGQAYLVDTGPGIVRRAAAAADKHDIDALQPPNLNRVFVTHLHSDHTAGFPDLILTPWVLERDVALEVVGPRGTRQMAQHILRAYQQDIDQRLNGLEPANPAGIEVSVVETGGGVVFENDALTVEAIPVPHGSWEQAFAYKFTTADKTVVISGDTTPSQSIIDACDRCDILVHEVYSTTGFERREPVWQKYHSSFHTSSEELAGIANASRPGLLILYHQLFWGASEQDLLAEIAANYDGEVVSASDLDLF